jgi:hypothetical protein
MSSPLKVSEIPKDEQHLVYNRSQLQIAVRLSSIAEDPFLGTQCLEQFPSINQHRKIRAINYDKVYRTNRLVSEINYLYSGKWWHTLPYSFLGDNHREHYFHILREQHFRLYFLRKYKRILKEETECSICKFKANDYKPEYSPFLELHETTPVDFNSKYKQIKKEDFIVVCPNCHKLEHEKIKNQ